MAKERVRVAVVQAAPRYLDRDSAVETACRWIRECGRLGVDLVAFAEGFVPGHPLWYHFRPATDPSSNALAARLYQNAIAIPGEETAALGAAARDAGSHVVIGVCERLEGTFGTLYNSQLFLGPDGSVLGKHQKLTPTVGERLVHTGGYGDTLAPVQTELGKVGGLICAESSNPLAVFAHLAEYATIEVISWPNRFPKKGLSCPERSLVVGRSVAVTSKAFVINACGIMTDEIRQACAYVDEDWAYLNDPAASGGSAIIGPDGRVIAGPMGPEEGIVWADVDLADAVEEKVRHDFAGHYNRADVFQLTVNVHRPQLFRHRLAPADAPPEATRFAPGADVAALGSGPLGETAPGG